MSENNKAVVRRLYEEGWNRGDLASLDQTLSPDFFDHEAPPGMQKGVEAAKQAFGMYLATFPDMKFELEELIAGGDRVVAKVTMTGTQKGPFLGKPASNEVMSLRGIDLFRVADGKVTDHWGAMNMWDLINALGVKLG